MNVLVTGGAGFIGAHLVAALVDAGATVRVLDDLSSGRREHLAGLPATLQVGDVADPAAVRAAARGCALVYHLAALVSAPRSLVEPALNHRANVDGTFWVLEAAREAGIPRVVYASSAAVYGNRPGLPKRESDPVEPTTPYATAKVVAERYAGIYAVAYGLETIGLRFMNVFGPRQDPGSPYSGVLSLFCRAAVAGEACTVHGDGEQTRDFVYVGDVVAALLSAGQVALPAGEPAPVVNIGRGEQTGLNQILAILADLVGRPLEVTHGPPRPGDIRHSVADITRARQLLGYAPRVTIQEGLANTLAWFRDGQPATRLRK